MAERLERKALLEERALKKTDDHDHDDDGGGKCFL